MFEIFGSLGLRVSPALGDEIAPRGPNGSIV